MTKVSDLSLESGPLQRTGLEWAHQDCPASHDSGRRISGGHGRYQGCVLQGYSAGVMLGFLRSVLGILRCGQENAVTKGIAHKTPGNDLLYRNARPLQTLHQSPQLGLIRQYDREVS